MSRKLFYGRVSLVDSSVVILVFLALCFFLGAMIGHALADCRQISQSTELASYLQSFVILLQNEEISQPSLGHALFSYCKYPVLVFLLSYTAFGVLLIPVLTIYQGFTTSFAVSVFIYTVSEHGFLLALLLFGTRCLVVLPCYFFLAGRAFSAAAERMGGAAQKKEDASEKYVLVRFLLCVVILAAGALLEHLFLAELLCAVV